MAFPAYKDIELPLLYELNAASGGRTSPIAIYEKVAGHFPSITAADLKVITRSANRRPSPIWNNMVQWARNDLVKKGEIEPPSVSGRGVWAISDKGRARLARERHLLQRGGRRRERDLREDGSAYEERVMRLRELRSRTQRQLVGIGAILQRFALSDFRQDGFQYDIIWKQGAASAARDALLPNRQRRKAAQRAASAEARLGHLGRKAVSSCNRRVRNPNRARKAYAALQRRVSGNRR